MTGDQVVSEILVARRVITAENLEDALGVQAERGGDLTEILLNNKTVTEEQMLRAVADECRKRKRWHFLLTVAPLAVEGGTGSPINPIATF